MVQARPLTSERWVCFCWFFLFHPPIAALPSLRSVVQCHCWKYHQLVNLICTASTTPTSVRSSCSSLSESLAEPCRQKFLLLYVRPRIGAKSRLRPREMKWNQIIIRSHKTKLWHHRPANHEAQSIPGRRFSRKLGDRESNITLWLSHIRSISIRCSRDVLVSSSVMQVENLSTQKKRRERKNHLQREKCETESTHDILTHSSASHRREPAE